MNVQRQESHPPQTAREKTGLLKKIEKEEAALVPVNKSLLKRNQSDDRYFSRREIF